MQKFETKNRNKTGLIGLSIFLLFKIFILGCLLLKNNETVQIDTTFNDSYYETQIITTIIIFVGFLMSLIRSIIWKPKYLFINDEGLKFINKQKEIFISFSEIESIKFNSAKIVTSKGKYRFPILHLKNLSHFLIDLKTKLNKDLSAKETKHVDNQIALDRYSGLWKKAITPQILFFLIFLFVSFNIIKSQLDYIYNFSFATEFMLVFSGFLAAIFAEILRYVNFKKNFDITKINDANQKNKTIWMIYGFFYLLWFVLIFITVLFYR